MSETLRDILNEARDDLKEWMTDNEGYTHNDLSDAIAEMADSAVPVYTADLMALAAEDIDLATTEPELGPAFDGTPTPANIIAANVYEAVSNHLHGIFREVEDEIKEENEDAA